MYMHSSFSLITCELQEKRNPREKLFYLFGTSFLAFNVRASSVQHPTTIILFARARLPPPDWNTEAHFSSSKLAK